MCKIIILVGNNGISGGLQKVMSTFADCDLSRMKNLSEYFLIFD